MVERIPLLRSSTSTIITIVTLLTISFALIFICSSLCPLVIWIVLFITCCIFLLPVLILRTERGKIELSGPSSTKLYRLLRRAKKIQIIQGDTEIVVRDYYIVSDTTIKWYESYTSKMYNVVNGIKEGDIILLDGAKLIII